MVLQMPRFGHSGRLQVVLIPSEPVICTKHLSCHQRAQVVVECPPLLWGAAVASEPVRITEPIKFGDDFELDFRAYELRRSGKPLKLERIPMELLVLLVERRGELVTRDQIIERIWGKDVFLDTDNSINAAVRKIRQVFKDDPERPRFVLTVTGKGYRFVAPVEEVSPPSPSPLLVSETKTPAAEDLLGKKVSHYRVLQILGGGGMGVVYKAEDLKLGRPVALKFLPSELASDPIAFERLQREARAASSLDHPNICSIHQLDDYEGQPFIVMQFLEGQTLREWIESASSKTVVERVEGLTDLALQIADGLEAAHQKGIIHRDIKPTNIFITRRGQAKILDFGVAKFVDAVEPADAKGGVILQPAEGTDVPAINPHLTRTGASIGTPSYLSPEQIRREKLDARTDLFSFGLVLYEMVTGQRAFSGATVTVIQEAVLHQPVPAPRQLDPRIPPELEAIIYKAVEKDRDVRYQSAADIRTDLLQLKRDVTLQQPVSPGIPEVYVEPSAAPAEEKIAAVRNARRFVGTRRAVLLLVVSAAIIAAAVFTTLYIRARRAIRLNAGDTIVLGDFANSTGDPIFDDTLKQALTLALRQSPFLNILPQSKINKTLKLMTRETSAQLTPVVAAEVCQRAGSKAYVAGAIGSLGSEYVLGLKAVNCQSGDVLAQEQVTAAAKEKVLGALGGAASKMRGELGESLNTVQKFDAPLAEATTPSLDALKAYSQGMKIWLTKGETEGLPYLKRAVELDPKFAQAYASLGTVYGNLGERAEANEYLSKAYELRDRVSEHERLSIVGQYYQDVTGELEKAAPVYEQWTRSYPSEATPHTNLGNIDLSLGRLQNALEEHRAAMQRLPDSVLIHVNLALTYTDLNRLEEAKAVVEDAFARKLDHPALHGLLYQIAVWRGDTAAAQREMSWAMGKAGVEDTFLALRADIEASFGHLNTARELTRRAIDSAVRSGSKETAANWQLMGALQEAELGNRKEAVAQVAAALSLASDRDSQTLAAMTFARAGDDARAKAIVDRINTISPLDTVVQYYWFPSIRAAVELNRANASKALDALQPATPYELATPIPASTMYPVYLRAEALLQLHKGSEAAAEFRRVLSYPALTAYVTEATARLELGRAYAMSGDTADAKKAYEEFFNRWKDADPDLPILRQARTEYSKLAPQTDAAQ